MLGIVTFQRVADVVLDLHYFIAAKRHQIVIKDDAYLGHLCRFADVISIQFINLGDNGVRYYPLQFLCAELDYVRSLILIV